MFTIKRNQLVYGALPIVLVGCSSMQYVSNELYKDNDWNTSFVSNCPLPDKESIRWMTEENLRFVRFTLSDKDKGGCITDRKARHNAPYWERAELRQNRKLDKNKPYVIQARVRFVEGFVGERENFFQIHSYSKNCKAYPPIMLKFDNRESSEATLTLSTQLKSKNHIHYRSTLRISDVRGKWIDLRVTLNQNGNWKTTVSVNGKPLFTDIPYWIEDCAQPHIKFGVYRPGNISSNVTSIVDYDSISIN